MKESRRSFFPRGMLLHGAPGLGKTLLANALIRESGLQAFTIRKNTGKEDLLSGKYILFS